MSKEFNVPITIKLTGVVAVEAENEDAAYEKADDTMYWAYQNGAPENHKAVSITDCEIAIDGEDIDLDEYRETDNG